MDEVVPLLAALLRIALVPLVGYVVLRFARRWPGATLTLLLILLALGSAALGYAWHNGFSVDPASRKMHFGSQIGRWCFAAGGVAVVLGVPALPLIAVARARNGANMGPVGPQWVVVLFGYFMACLIFGMVLYSLLTGVVK
jgi:hypothetical protein